MYLEASLKQSPSVTVRHRRGDRSTLAGWSSSLWVVSFASAARSILEASARVLTPIFTCCYSKATGKWEWRNSKQTFLASDKQYSDTESKSDSINESASTGWGTARWQPGCMFRLYCGSTVWPVSQCNPQTIPCCYSIARAAVMVP